MSASCSILLRAAIINDTPGSGSVARSARSSTGSVSRERLQQHIGYRFSRPELFERFGELSEGDLSRLRAQLVREETLHQVAQTLRLGDHLQLGEGELKSGGFARPSILADAFEALIGAVFVDGGFPAARETIRRLYEPLLANLDPKALGKDPKTLLQELLQARKIALPQYSVVATHGAAHSQNFEVECLIPQLSVRTTGIGSSRRNAEQEAAMRAFE